MLALAGNPLLIVLVAAHVLFAALAFEMATGRASIPATFAVVFIGALAVAALALVHRRATPESQRTMSSLRLFAIAALVVIGSPIQLAISDQVVTARDLGDVVRPWTEDPGDAPDFPPATNVLPPERQPDRFIGPGSAPSNRLRTRPHDFGSRAY